jgi:hypothetical protein
LSKLGLLEENEDYDADDYFSPANSHLADGEELDPSIFEKEADTNDEDYDADDYFSPANSHLADGEELDPSIFDGIDEEEETDEADREFHDWKYGDNDSNESLDDEYDPEDPEFDNMISKYMNDGEGTLEDDYLSDDERHSALGKMNRGDDLEENIDIKSKDFEKYLKLLEDDDYPSSDNPKSEEDPDTIGGTKLA